MYYMCATGWTTDFVFILNISGNQKEALLLLDSKKLNGVDESGNAALILAAERGINSSNNWSWKAKSCKWKSNRTANVKVMKKKFE